MEKNTLISFTLQEPIFLHFTVVTKLVLQLQRLSTYWGN